MLGAQERIDKICHDNDVTLSEFTPLSLNGMVRPQRAPCRLDLVLLPVSLEIIET